MDEAEMLEAQRMQNEARKLQIEELETNLYEAFWRAGQHREKIAIIFAILLFLNLFIIGLLFVLQVPSAQMLLDHFIRTIFWRFF